MLPLLPILLLLVCFDPIYQPFEVLWCCVVSATSPAIVLDVIDYLVIGIDAALRIKAAAIVIR